MRILGKIAAVLITGILLTALAWLIFSKPVPKVTVVSLGPGRRRRPGSPRPSGQRTLPEALRGAFRAR
jgi:hypothetical protein